MAPASDLANAPQVHPGGPTPSAPAGYPPYGGPPAHHPYGGPYGGYPLPPGIGLPRPVAVAPVGDTPFAVALVEVRPLASGQAIASLVAGIASILVSLVVGIFVAAGVEGGWGPSVAGAFAVLATLLCAAAVGLSVTARRRIRDSVAWGATRGHGMAVAGLSCGLSGLAITALSMALGIAAA